MKSYEQNANSFKQFRYEVTSSMNKSRKGHFMSARYNSVYSKSLEGVQLLLLTRNSYEVDYKKRSYDLDPESVYSVHPLTFINFDKMVGLCRKKIK